LKVINLNDADKAARFGTVDEEKEDFTHAK
jgi:hypothetical protein